MPPLRDATIRLPDGRRLAYAEWGDPNGSPVVLFHGTPGSRLWCPDERATVAAGVRLVTPDRPGIGRSDVKPARTYADWPSDVVGLADALGIGRFAVVGWSGGGPYAASCAALIAARLTAVGIVSSKHLARYNFVERPGAIEELDRDERALLELAPRHATATAELAASQYASWVKNLQEHPESIHEPAATAEGDRWFFADEARAAAFDAATREGVRQGTDGVRWELIDGFFPWGFPLADILMQVYLWHGEQDSRVKQEDIDFLVAKLPICTAINLPDAGHFGIAKHWGEILRTLTEPAPLELHKAQGRGSSRESSVEEVDR